MTVKQLLQPRYKVIADYPDSPHEIDDILELTTNNWRICECYPHIFKKLEWWENRTWDHFKKIPFFECVESIGPTSKGEVLSNADFVWWEYSKDRSTWNCFIPTTKNKTKKPLPNG